jgi:translocation and assembly module TamB
VQDVGRLVTHPGLSLSGAVTLSATAHGLLTAPELEARLNSPELTLAGESLRDVMVTVTAADAAERRGTITVDGVVRGLPLHLQSDWELSESRMLLPTLCLQGPDTEVNGDLALLLPSLLASGRVRGSGSQAILRPWLGHDINGRATLTLDLTTAADRQQAELDLRLDGIGAPRFDLDAVTLTATAADLRGTPEVRLAAALSGLRHGRWTVQEAHMRVAGTRESAEFQVDATGDRGSETVSLAISGRTAWPGFLVLDHASAIHGSTPVELLTPLRVAREGDVLVLAPMALGVGTGRLTAEGRVGPEKLEGRLQLAGLAMADLAPAGLGMAAGTLDGVLELAGTPSFPRADLALTANGLELLQSFDEMVFAGSARLEGGYDDGRLRGRLAVRGSRGETVTARLDLPLSLSLTPPASAWVPAQDWSGDLHVDADLGQVLMPLPPDGNVFHGRLRGRLSLGGSPDNPLLDGRLEVQDALYENYLTGTALRGLNLRLEGSGNELRLSELRADDGRSGRLNSSGRWRLGSQEADALSLDLHLSEFVLHDQPQLSIVAAGSLALSGSPADLRLSGDLDVGPVEARILGSRNSIVNLEVVETRGGVPVGPTPQPEPRSGQDAPVRAPRPVALDLRVSSLGRVYVRGRGLDTEWRGDLRLTGTTLQPQLTGDLTMVRGTYTLGARRLRIVEGRLSFDGAYPILPTIHVVAEDVTTDLFVRVVFSGPMDAPVLRLESQPVMPTDEILARVLFRRGTGQISAFQALALASVVEDFTTGGNAFDVNDRLRRLTGLDQISIVTGGDAAGAASLQVGKYLTDRVYVQVDRGLGATADNRVTVEVDLTPRFSIETSAGTAGGGLGLNWRFDY